MAATAARLVSGTGSPAEDLAHLRMPLLIKDREEGPDPADRPRSSSHGRTSGLARPLT
jgi:hypothetical protein